MRKRFLRIFPIDLRSDSSDIEREHAKEPGNSEPNASLNFRSTHLDISMSNKDDPEWEIVDSLPKKRRPTKPNARIRIPRKFLIGAGIGLALVIIFPPAMRLLLNLMRNFIAYWWLLVVVIGYWFAKRQLTKRR